MKALGELEHLILLALMNLGDEAYGVSIRREIEDRATRQVATGALYTILARLEDKGLVSSRVGEPTPSRGGRSKKYYRLEAPGERALASTHAAIRGMTRDIEGKLDALLKAGEPSS